MAITAKQQEVVDIIRRENPKILVCHGAKRSGKTFILTFAFLAQIAKYKGLGLSFILGGATQASIRRNVLDDVEKIIGRDLKLDKTNAVEIFGNKVYCFDGQNSDSWKKVRGFTAAGAFLNEGTALHDDFVKEVISRCSYEGARIYIDTNPERPMHSVKIDYVDKDGQTLKNGQTNIRAVHFALDDNTQLPPEYIESMKLATPSGMYYDRDILGLWVNAEGVVYPDFTEDLYLKDLEGLSFKSFFCGVDWGYEHYGAIVVFGEHDNGVTAIEMYTAKHQEIEYWERIAQDIKARRGNIPFYCDSARPEHISRFRRIGLRARNADKAILSGIEQVARRFKNKTLTIYDNGKIQRFRQEIAMYAWNEKTGEPIKLYDDVLDAIRYAIYTHYGDNRKVKIYDKAKVGLY